MSIRTRKFIREVTLGAVGILAVLAAPPRAAADEHVLGVITDRGDTTFAIVQENGMSLQVALVESTRITTSKDKKMSASDLIPGLRVKVEGEFDSQNRLVAQ